ncbi:YET1 (YKL065C) and YET2 (YMR040W) [Zygosaccharomyces parabailii]|nr:YET1 (YKL065C) and YET2 (YMR040W) [Zygosaccharomyces parabailii]CDH11747.1 related to Endoplasmic reticulum transmembrane protein 1 [Zygosaccharomyces bailii ISA1307]
MSLYLSGLFGLLTVEMTILFVVVLPLPFVVRRKIYALYYKWTSSRKVMTSIYIFAGLVSILFVDSWRRAQFKVWLHHYSREQQEVDENGSVTPTQALATRAYNQRNTYISGFILYFLVCIPSVFTIIRRLIKYQNLINKLEGKPVGPSTPGTQPTNKGKGKVNSTKEGKPEFVDEREIDHLKHELERKDVDLEGLQKQVKNLENYFDEQNDQKRPKKTPSKKDV